MVQERREKGKKKDDRNKNRMDCEHPASLDWLAEFLALAWIYYDITCTYPAVGLKHSISPKY